MVLALFDELTALSQVCESEVAGCIAIGLRNGEQITLEADVVWRLQLCVQPRVIQDVGDCADGVAGHGWAVEQISKGDIFRQLTDVGWHRKTWRNGELCHRLKRLGMVRQASRCSM
jgi:hypothetical protein